jgi:hypothetical protein
MRTKLIYSLSIIVFLVLLLSRLVVAGNYFVDCEKALRSKDFSGLHAFYERNKDQPPPDKCFKMNNNEYLITVVDTGRIGQGLYYVNIKENKAQLDEGSYTPNMKIEHEFLGKNKKRYALYSWSNLHGGNYETGYAVLFLTPKSDGKSWKTSSLFSVLGDPEGGLCGDRIKTGKAGSVEGFKISGEGTEKVKIVFTVIEQDCKTLKTTTARKVFSQSGPEFRLER